jgi:hypothetical protein
VVAWRAHAARVRSDPQFSGSQTTLCGLTVAATVRRIIALFSVDPGHRE